MTSRYLFFVALVICASLVGLVLTFGSPSSKRLTEADIDLLASDAHIVVGDAPLVLPFVALTGYVGQKQSFSFNKQKDRQAAKERLDAFRKAAANPQSAPTISEVEVTMRPYGWDDNFGTGTDRICSRLRRQWSKSLCDNPWAALQQALPNNRFDLIDLRNLTDSDKTDVGKCLSPDEHDRPVVLQPGKASLLCERKLHGPNRVYAAAVRIDRHLGAIWYVWEGTQSEETAREMADREGKAIFAFVTNGLGSLENFAELHETVCALRRPHSVDAPAGPDCGTARLPMSPTR